MVKTFFGNLSFPIENSVLQSYLYRSGLQRTVLEAIQQIKIIKEKKKMIAHINNYKPLITNLIALRRNKGCPV